MQNRPAAGGHRVDVQHRRAQPDPGNLGREDAFVLAGVVRHVGRGAAHVEANNMIEAGQRRHPHHADDAAGRTRQNRVLAAEVPGLRQPPVGLHEHQSHTPHLVGHLVDVSAQHRGQVGVDHGGIPARDQFHQRADLR
ncbi:Uncharacterised protein [Mycobacterium tuberculosis]|nr:Uncharacterised protein [Mycobacterium tuberculosis]